MLLTTRVSSTTSVIGSTIHSLLRSSGTSCHRFLGISNTNLTIYNSSFHILSRRQHSEQQPPPRPEQIGDKKAKLTPQSAAAKSKPFIRWSTIAITACLGGALYWYLKRLDREKELARYAERQKSIGRSKIGGEWSDLVDQNGEKRSWKDYLGSWVLLYFGFTHCPDVCPDELEKLCNAVDILQARNPKEKFTPLMITVDPKRDDLAAMKKYVAEFSPKLIGLTGGENVINDVAKKFRVYYSAGPESKEADYIVDHTIIIYLIDPEGQFLDYYGQSKSAEEIADRVGSHMAKQSLLKFW